MRTITLLSATPWLASACPTIAAKAVVVPSVDAWGKLSGSAAAELVPAQAALGRSAVRDRGESGFGAARPMYAHDQLTQLIPNGGEVRGLLPWREPVTT
ncbi:hypothetical protein AB0K60_22980 [Thermopolyspora sp. NPDC052614]|uniref:hypothetical protein n=1 Tax=Thermopolyspora sp. NPDC052614 TaxID=3155682 RepID=UPI00343FEB3B